MLTMRPKPGLEHVRDHGLRAAQVAERLRVEVVGPRPADRRSRRRARARCHRCSRRCSPACRSRPCARSSPRPGRAPRACRCGRPRPPGRRHRSRRAAPPRSARDARCSGAAITTSAPSRASSRAIPRPMPWPPPVTIAVRSPQVEIHSGPVTRPARRVALARDACACSSAPAARGCRAACPTRTRSGRARARAAAAAPRRRSARSSLGTVDHQDEAVGRAPVEPALDLARDRPRRAGERRAVHAVEVLRRSRAGSGPRSRATCAMCSACVRKLFAPSAATSGNGASRSYCEKSCQPNGRPNCGERLREVLRLVGSAPRPPRPPRRCRRCAPRARAGSARRSGRGPRRPRAPSCRGRTPGRPRTSARS